MEQWHVGLSHIQLTFDDSICPFSSLASFRPANELISGRHRSQNRKPFKKSQALLALWALSAVLSNSLSKITWHTLKQKFLIDYIEVFFHIFVAKFYNVLPTWTLRSLPFHWPQRELGCFLTLAKHRYLCILNQILRDAWTPLLGTLVDKAFNEQKCLKELKCTTSKPPVKTFPCKLRSKLPASYFLRRFLSSSL